MPDAHWIENINKVEEMKFRLFMEQGTVPSVA